MQINGVFEAVRRRLLPLLGVMLLAVVAAGVGWVSTTTVYDATAVAVVVPGNEPSGSDQEGSNPLSRVGFATTQLATLTTVVATAPSLQASITQQTGATLVSANNTAQERTSAPQAGIQIVVVTRAETKEAAIAGGNAAIRLMDGQLQDLQQKVGVEAKQRARVVDLVPAEATASSSRSRLRAAGGLFVGVIGLGTVAVLAGDALMQYQRRRATHAPQSGTHLGSSAAEQPSGNV